MNVTITCETTNDEYMEHYLFHAKDDDGNLLISHINPFIIILEGLNREQVTSVNLQLPSGCEKFEPVDYRDWIGLIISATQWDAMLTERYKQRDIKRQDIKRAKEFRSLLEGMGIPRQDIISVKSRISAITNMPTNDAIVVSHGRKSIVFWQSGGALQPVYLSIDGKDIPVHNLCDLANALIKHGGAL